MKRFRSALLLAMVVVSLAGCPGAEIGVSGGYNKETGEISGEVDLTLPKKDPSPAPTLPQAPAPVTEKK